MRKLIIILFVFVLSLFVLRDYYAVVSQSDYGLALSVRSTTAERFAPVFVWRW